MSFVGIRANIEDLIAQTRMRWYGHVLCLRIEKQIKEVLDLEKKGKHTNSKNTKNRQLVQKVMGKVWEKISEKFSKLKTSSSFVSKTKELAVKR